MYSTIKLRTSAIKAVIFYLEIGVDASDTPVGYIDARDFIGDLLVNGPMRDELRVSKRVEAIERWYETTGADMKFFHFYKHKEYLAKWFSAPPVMP